MIIERPGKTQKFLPISVRLKRTDQIIYTRADTGVKTLEHMRTVAEPPECGSTGISSSAYHFPRLISKH